jgi:hypothetical protein
MTHPLDRHKLAWFLFIAAMTLIAATPYLCIAETHTFYPDSTNGETITVTFTYQSGTGTKGYFANGPNEPWVADSEGGWIKITDVDPEPSDPCQICADLNPAGDYAPTIGLNTHFAGYAAAENVLAAFDSTDADTHITIPAGNTIVFGLGFNSVQYGDHWQKAYAILTVLAAAPSPATDGYWFRPHWGAGPKVVEYNTADVNLAVFPDLEAVAGGPDHAAALLKMQRSGIDAWISSYNQYYHSAYGLDFYGSEVGREVADLLFWLCEAHTDGEKLPSACALIQYGLDLSRMFEYGTNARGYPALDSVWGFHSGWGGHVVGRFMPVVLAAKCLGDSLATEQLSKSGTSHVDQYPYAADAIGFGESVQVHRLNTTGYPLATAQRSQLALYPSGDVWGTPYNYTVGKSLFYGGNAITAGTATFTHDSTAVVGDGTSWTSGYDGYMIMLRPDYIGPYAKDDGYQMLRADGRAYTISSVSDTTHLTLTAPWLGDTGTCLYGIASFIGLDRCNQATAPFEDYNEITLDDVGTPMFQQGGSSNSGTVGLKYPRFYEDINMSAFLAAALGLLLTDSQDLGEWSDLLDYADATRYQWGSHDEPAYCRQWFLDVWDTWRPLYASTWPVWKPFAPNAGADQIVMWENKGHVHLVGTARNLLVNRIAAAPVYTWTDSESNVVGTGLTPDAIALPAAGSYVFTLTGVATEHDYIAEPDVHRDFTETDTVTVTVRPQVKFLVRRKTE